MKIEKIATALAYLIFLASFTYSMNSTLLQDNETNPLSQPMFLQNNETNSTNSSLSQPVMENKPISTFSCPPSNSQNSQETNADAFILGNSMEKAGRFQASPETLKMIVVAITLASAFMLAGVFAYAAYYSMKESDW